LQVIFQTEKNQRGSEHLRFSKTIYWLYLAGWFGWLTAYMIGESEMMLNQVCMVNKSNNAIAYKQQME
jgi:hypothetical protein